MSERPPKVTSPSAPREDPPIEPVVEEASEETQEGPDSRPSSDGRKRRAKKSGGNKPKSDRDAGLNASRETAEQTENSQTSTPLDTPEPLLATKPETMDQYLDMTRNEKIKKLSDKLAGFKAPEDLKKVSMKDALFDHRATQIIEKIGLGNERASMLAAQSAYLEAKTLAHKQGFSADNIGDLKRAYTDSLFEWNTALLSASEKVDGKQRLEVLAIRKRDTILRPQNIEIAARKAGIDAKAWYSLDKWINEETPANLARIVNAPTSLAGKGWAALWHKSARGNSTEAKISRAELGRKYARAGRILGGAAVATGIALAASPVTATTLGLTFAVYAGRGVIGTAAGMAGGYAGGGLYQRLFGSKKKESLNFSQNASKKFENAEEFEAFQLLYGANSTRARSKEKAMWQIGGALLAGGSTGMATSPVAHGILEQFGGLKSVQDASDTLSSADAPRATVETPRLPETTLAAQDMAPAAASTAIETTDAAIPNVPKGPFLHEAVIGKGEGFNQLIVDLRASGFTGFDANLSASEISEKLGALVLTGENGELVTPESATMQVGDKLFVDANQNVWFERNGEVQLLLENATTPSGEVVMHELKNVDLAPTIDRPESAATPVLNATEAVVQGVPEDVATVAVAPNEVVPTPPQVPEVASNVPQQNDAEPIRTETVAPEATTRIPGIENIDDYNARIAAEAAMAASSSEGITNMHNVEVNPAETAVYEWKDPQTGIARITVFGGSAEEISMAVQSELSLDPTARVFVNTPVVDAQTGALTMRVDEWRIGDEGEPRRAEGIQDANGRSLPPITAENLIRKIR